MPWLVVLLEETVCLMMSIIGTHIWEQQCPIVCQNYECGCNDAPYTPRRRYCEEIIEGAWTGQTLQIHYNPGLNWAERDATHIIQLLNQTKALKRDGYAISNDEFKADSSNLSSISNDDIEPPPYIIDSTLDLNSIPLDSSDKSSDESSNGLEYGFENYKHSLVYNILSNQTLR